ncbi:hypothetical protein DC498_14825 [Terrimonas sp.]|nr:hypothetical protein DC498_14825 [Terrimonas sp.]
MPRKTKILFSVGGMLLGWLLNAFAWTTTMGHPVNTISLLLGGILFLGGLIFLIITLIKGR